MLLDRRGPESDGKRAWESSQKERGGGEKERKKEKLSWGSGIKPGSGCRPPCSLCRRKTPRGNAAILTCEIPAKRKYFLLQLAVAFPASCN